MAYSPNSLLAVKQDVPEIKQNELPNAKDDGYGGVRVQMKDPMDSKVFASLLKASLSKWRQQNEDYGPNEGSVEMYGSGDREEYGPLTNEL
ncbi:hypothetical protein L1049_024528 [Liquidambar formosana]|uniref:Pre-nudix hydrolase domain-containing protein n=1 Tax=Liquidambar formosana TaxID=63359 RepID=A0AAP0WZP6_LIQFO